MIQESTMNQMGNAANKHQGPAKRVLCVCSAGMLRSPTAAVVLQREFGFNTRSAGISDYALIPVSEVLVEWADQIIFMDEEHEDLFRHSIYKKMEKEDAERVMSDTITLNIPDKFEYMDEKLQKLIVERYNAANS